MEKQRIRIVDIAEQLGVSTATVSNVIHGKTAKISDTTVKMVQQKLEEMQYIPNMAGILLAQNNSRIIGVLINDHPKYEGKVLEDGFIFACKTKRIIGIIVEPRRIEKTVKRASHERVGDTVKGLFAVAEHRMQTPDVQPGTANPQLAVRAR